MKVTIQVTKWSAEEISISTTVIDVLSSRFNRVEDPKWVKFCKEHHFHPRKDLHTKYYDLYLRLCAEGML